MKIKMLGTAGNFAGAVVGCETQRRVSLVTEEEEKVMWGTLTLVTVDK